MASQAALELAVSLKDQASKGLDDLGKKGGILQTALGFATGGVITKGIDAITGSIGGLVSGMIDGNAQMEDFGTQFEVMTGSAQNASKLMSDLQTMGAKTPFEFTDLAAGTQTLLAFGRAQKDVIPDLQMLGDISGGNKDKLNSLSLVYGQVASNGKMMGGDLLQMINAGFNPLNIISQKTGKSMSELRDEMSKGQISFEMVRDAMATATSKGGQFYGMMDKQSSTFNGLMSTLQDNFSAAMRTLGQPIFDKLKEGLNWLIAFLSKPEVQAGISSFANMLANGIGAAGDAIGKVITFLSPLVTYIQQFFATIQGGEGPMQAFGDLFANIGGFISDAVGQVISAIGAALPGIVAQLGQWAQAFISWIGPQIPGILAQLGNFLGSILGWIFGTALPALIENLGTWAKAFVDWIGPQIPVMWNKLVEFGGKVWEWLINEGLPTLISKLGEWGKALIDWIGPRILPALGELGKFLVQVGEWIITTALPTIISKLAEWGGAFINWIAKDALPFIVPKLGEFAAAIWNWLTTTAIPTAIEKLKELGAAFIGWVGKDALPFIGQKLGELAQAIWNWVSQTAKDAWNKVLEIGSSIVNGIKQGISNTWNSFVNWLSGMVKDALPQFIKDWLGIKSPSRVFADIGEQLVLGFRNGINDTWVKVEDALVGNITQTTGLIKDTVGGTGEGWGGAVLGWGDTGTTGTGGMFGAFNKGLKDIADTAATVTKPAMQQVAKEFDPKQTSGMMGLITPALDIHSDTSFSSLFNDSTNAIFKHTNEAWIPQMRTAFIGWFTDMTTWFTEYTAMWVRVWQNAMANMTPPSLPGGGGGGTGGGNGGGTGGGGGGRTKMDRLTGGGGGFKSSTVSIGPIYVGGGFGNGDGYSMGDQIYEQITFRLRQRGVAL